MCDVLEVSRSGYYCWLARKPSKRAMANQDLDVKIKAIYRQNHKCYGSPRITRELKVQGETCSHTRVTRRMRSMDIKAIAKRKFKVTTDSEHSKLVFNNILNRNFDTTGVNQKWASDILY